jgi:HK97 family phage major capsid protein
MDNQETGAPIDASLDASFDIVARQNAADQALGALRGEIEEVKSRFERATRASHRPLIGAGAGVNLEMKGFVDGYLRQGRESELKSMTVGSVTDGGYAVPTELDAKIAERLIPISPIRSIAQVVQTSTSDYRKLISLGGTVSGWVSETAARAGTSSPSFAEIIPPYGDLYANPSASQQMLDDAMFDLEGWLAQEVATEFGRAEGAAFVNGTGVSQPKGFLTSPSAAVADATRAFGTLQYLPSGDGATLGTTPDTLLIDVVMSLKPGHRQGAVWVMNSKTLSAVRKLKDTDGAFIWQGSLIDGQPDRLLGYPVVEAADMPDIGAGNTPIAFGNFQNGYIITERFATRVLRDPYSNKPFVNFYATRRVGGQVLDSEAIKLVKVATS